ncbi:hypothetical protein DFQ27_004181 [Actinomortierella ambigua]|uniref:DUF3533 domain-containing protein n=1 Tax=Actinomortierella ambigua TaxID=1343610 RepID=A0A9P6Q3Q5_9FUNG|nr:hypothetical protein DFQ27_004181 [Actinomortierella ambigua]
MDPSQEKQYPKGVPPEPPFKLTSASTLNEGPDDDLTLDERECIEHPDVIRKKPSLFKAMPQVLVLPHLLSSTIGILLVISSLVVAAYIWLYMGSLWSPLSRVKNVPILLCNQDTGFNFSSSPGQVRRLFQNITGGAPVGTILQKQIMDPEGLVHKAFEWHDVSAQPGWTRESLIQEVDLGHYWGLLYIPANFSTALLMNAPTRQGPANISTPVTIEYVFDQGRNYATQGIIEKVMLTTVNGLIQGFLQRLLSSLSSPTLMATMTPSFWVKPIHFSETILHPVLQYGESFASYMVFVVAYIGSLLTVNCIARYLPSNVETFGMLTIGDDKEYRHFPALRIVLARHTVAIMFSTVHSLLIWMVPRVLHGYSTVGSTAFVAFVFTFLCTWSFLSVLFFMCRVFTIDGFQIPATLFLILQLTTSSSIMDWILTPGFYRIGIVFPMTYAVRGMRYIFFGSLKDKMWINWLVIAAYIVVPGILTVYCARRDIRRRRKALHTLDAARQARRQEWEQAYKDAENPPPPPEEEPDYDPRTLYERLQEQRQKKDDAFREATKFGNLIKKLDGDEFDFLSNLHEEEDKKKRDMAELEAQALEEFRSSVKSTTVAPPAPVSLSSTLGTTNIGGTGSATSLLASTSAATLISRKPRKSAFSGLVVGKEDKKSGATSPPDTAADSSKRKQGSETTSTGDEKSAAHTNKKLKSDHVGKSAVSSSSSSSELSNKDTKGAAASSSNAVAPKGISSLVSYASDSSDEE